MSASARWAPALLVLVAVVMLVAGLLGLQLAVFAPVLDAWKTRNWVETTAILDDFKLLASDGSPIAIISDPSITPEQRASVMPTGIIKISVRYHYYVENESYDGNRWGLFEGPDDGDAQRLAVARMHRKQEIQAWVNPNNPKESILNRDLHWGVMALGLPLLATVLVGLVILGYGAKTWWEVRSLAKRVQLAEQ
jgi:hypothetical protein